MKRSRILSVTIFLILIVISACVKSFSPGPIYEPSPDENFIDTSVAATLTALAPATLTASPTALFTQTLNPGAMTPHDFIYYYFDNINRRNYSLTWSLLTDRFKARLNSPSQGGYDGYVAFWNSVEQVTVNNAFYVCNGDLCAVNTTLQLNYTNGVDNTSPYDYTVIYNHSLNTWMFDFIPAPTAVPSKTFTATRTPTATATATKTSTPTNTATKTFTVSSSPTVPTLTFTPTQTASATVSQTPSATASPTATSTFTATETPTVSPTTTETPTSVPTDEATPTFTPTETASS